MLAPSTANAQSSSHAAGPALGRDAFQDTTDPLYCISTVQVYEPKQPIFYEGDSADHLFEVIEGVVKLYKLTCDGRCQVTGFLYPGQLLGLGSGDYYGQTAEAVTSARLCQYSKSRLETIIDRHPTVGSRLLASISNELIAAQDQMLLLGRKSAIEKFCSFLLRLSAAAERRGDDADRIYLPMNRSEIADYLGLTTETISRTVSRLKDLSVINLPDARLIVVLDPDRLVDLADDEEASCSI